MQSVDALSQQDSYRHKGLRKKLVELLRDKGIHQESVLDAIGEVPRHYFLDPAFVDHAYEDKAFRIGEKQTISQPYTVAYQSSLLDLRKGMKVLEIGTGSGYQSSILAAMGARVYSIERFRSLHLEAKARLQRMGMHRVKCFFGDGFKGLPTYAPFDRIIITAAASEWPTRLFEQLGTGAMLVMPYVQDDKTLMLRIHRQADGSLEQETFDEFRFVPMLRGKVH